MIKKFISLVIFTAVITSCGNTGKNSDKTDEAADSGMAQVEFTSLTENPDQFLDKDIAISGKVVHVCMHTGKKMYIVGENPDIRLFITAGEEVPQFPQELLGSEITVEGHLTRLAAGGKMMGEGEGKMAEGEGEMAEGEECETEAAVAAQPVLADFVLEYRNHTVK